MGEPFTDTEPCAEHASGPRLLAGGEVQVYTLCGIDGSKASRRERARQWLRELLAAELQTSAQALKLSREPAGKPYLPGGEVQFNVSHSGTVAMAALSRTRTVGIDVQQLRALRDEQWWRRRLCTESERALNPSGAELIRLWTRKEAVLKATGEGLAREPNTVDVSGSLVTGGWVCVDLPSPADGFLAAVSYAQAPATAQAR